MTKPSEVIALIYEEIIDGKKSAEAMTYNQMCGIIHAIIHYLDHNAIMAEEKRKAREKTGGK